MSCVRFQLLSGMAFLIFSLNAFALPDIVFVTQPPHPSDFATANATFGNHRASLDSIPRGGDLYIRYADGTLRNLTKDAGYGMEGFQGANAIAVRDPAVHWDAQKIIFSMVIGAPTQQYQVQQYRWQLYEITNFAKNQAPIITKVTNQPEDYNNVMPVYGNDDKIIFVSDRPLAGMQHTYPQRDEYESTATNTGLWRLDPANGNLEHLDHSPSGDFDPIIDSFGRVIFTRWDHLQRDQQNRCSQASFKAFNYESEEEGAEPLDTDAEVYPEPRANCEITDSSTNLTRHSFNVFLPWQINQDGTEIETINHIGRHELVDYIDKSFNNDSNVVEYYGQYSRVNPNAIDGFFQIQEDPTQAGKYYGISAPEFGTHASGQIINISLPPGQAPDQVVLNYVTHPVTQNTSDSPGAEHIGLSRDVLPLSDGQLIASHSGSTRADANTGSSAQPASRYAYRLRLYDTSGQYAQPDTFLTSGIKETISYWSPDQMISYNDVTLWELQAQEIRERERPELQEAVLPAPEQLAFSSAGVDQAEFRDFLRENNLALIVSRNVTTRDALDHQQPLNLRIAGTNTQTIKEEGKVYDVAHMQIFQGDLIRAYGGIDNPQAGRRVIAQHLHSVDLNPANPEGPTGSVKLGSDGSMAALVPAGRALTYQLTDTEGQGVVRERLWLTFQAGEIRVCASCHGVNSEDQIGDSAPQNTPQALIDLLSYLKDGGFESPQMSLELSPATGPKSRGKYQVVVAGLNDTAAEKTVKLSVRLGKLDCGEVKSFVTDAQGAYSFTTGRLPKFAKRKGLNISLMYNLQELDSTELRSRIKKKKAIKGKNKKICSVIERAFAD